MAQPVPILLYHSISETAHNRFRRWTVAPRVFAAHMRQLADGGYRPVAVSDFLALRANAALPEKPVVITFDDGYRDFVTRAMPVLVEHRFPVTLFVTSGYVGGTSEWLIRERETDRQMLTWTQLGDLPHDLVELGGHGYSHRQLDTLPLGEALADVERGVELLSRRTHRPITTFAYPHGYATAEIEAEIGRLGLVGACGVGDALSSPAEGPYKLSRVIVDGTTTPALLRRIVDGAGVRIGQPHAEWQQRLWRSWRRTRLAVGIDKAHVPV